MPAFPGLLVGNLWREALKVEFPSMHSEAGVVNQFQRPAALVPKSEPFHLERVVPFFSWPTVH